MIAPVLVAEIKRLLANSSLSQRKIAQKVGVSRGTVSGIANGSRPDYEAIRREREQEEALAPTGPLMRCPSCGGMVYAPCRLCHIRALLANRRQKGPHLHQRRLNWVNAPRAAFYPNDSARAAEKRPGTVTSA
ncbi:MAG: helix-turn-helix transcriptional regulator [Planctomycetales bacterium]|nr:helix-turn-helix transcriptional regulator [Planctomycetales bacterium]